MEYSKYILRFLLIVFLHTINLSNSKSIVNKLPGYHGDLPFTLETGYVEVGEDNGIQFFYYFVESQRDPFSDPLLLYLTGGPGTPALYPFLYQIGPLSIDLENSSLDNVTLNLNPNSWTKTSNIIFIDLPAGVGFSYAETWEASRSTGDSVLASHCYEFIRKWLLEHPRFQDNPLYISGISYMGILVPVITLKAYEGNERGTQPRLNIKGSLIVSPLTDKFSDFNSRVEFAHRLALISDEIYESTKESCRGNYVDPSNSLCLNSLQRVDECTKEINLSNILDPVCDDVNPAPTCHEADKKYLKVWANDKVVQKALHVREGTIGSWENSNADLHYDFKKNNTIYYAYDIFSSIVYHKQLLTKNCQVLIINGDHDMNFPYVGTMGWITSLSLPIETPWNPWFVGSQIAGYRMTYAKNGYSLTYATVKGAGHAVALYKPQEASVIVDGWLASHIYSSDSRK